MFRLSRTKIITGIIIGSLSIPIVMFQNFTNSSRVFTYPTETVGELQLANGQKVFKLSMWEMVSHLHCIDQGWWWSVKGANDVRDYLLSYNGNFQIGDINNNGKIDSLDVSILAGYARNDLADPRYDRSVQWIKENIESKVQVKTPLVASTADLSLATLNLAVGKPASTSLEMFLAGRVISEAGFSQLGDINSDGKINSYDALLFQQISQGLPGVAPAVLDRYVNTIKPFIISRTPLIFSIEDLPKTILQLAVRAPTAKEIEIFLLGNGNNNNQGQGPNRARADINGDGKITSADALAAERFVKQQNTDVNQTNWIRSNITPFISKAQEPAVKLVIQSPKDGVVGKQVVLQILALDQFGKRVMTYNGQVKLVGTGSVEIIGGGLVNLVNGEGSAAIINSKAEVINLKLVEANNSGLNVSSTQSVLFKSATAPNVTHECKLFSYRNADFSSEAGSSASSKITNQQECLTVMNPSQLDYNLHQQCKSWRIFFNGKSFQQGFCKNSPK